MWINSLISSGEETKKKQELEELRAKLNQAEQKHITAEKALALATEQHEAEKKEAQEERAKRKEEHKKRHQERKEAKMKRKQEKKEAKERAEEEEKAKKAAEVAEDKPETLAPVAATEAQEAQAQKTKKDEEEEEPSIPTKYVIVGGGAAGYCAMKQIISTDPEAQILFVSEEPSVPYDRSPLTVELFRQQDLSMVEQLEYEVSGQVHKVEYPSKILDHPSMNITYLSGRKAIDLDPGRHTITLDDGSVYKYEKCLLATGTKPNDLDVSLPEGASDRVTHLRTVEDFKKLHRATLDPNVKHITVIGNDYTAADLVDGLAERARIVGSEMKVSQVFPEEGVLASVFPSDLSSYLTKLVGENLNVDVNPGVHIESISSIGDTIDADSSSETSPAPHRLRITLDNAKTIDTDHIVLSLGGSPNVELAKRAVLEIDELNGGVVVNSELSARTDVYVAGDAASFFDGHLGRRRVDGVDHAEVSGRYAGMNMSGHNYAYVYQPMRWGSLARSIAYENVGIVDSRLDMVAVWQKGPNAPLIAPDVDDAHSMPLLVPDPNAPLSTEYLDAGRTERGVVYYMNGTKVVGVSMINVHGQTDVAKRLITFPRTFEDTQALTRQIYLGNKPKVEDENDDSPL